MTAKAQKFKFQEIMIPNKNSLKVTVFKKKSQNVPILSN